MLSKLFNTTSKLCALGIVAASFTLLPHAYAAEQKTEEHAENIEVTQQQVTSEELAAIFVLSEICPALVEKNKAFDQGYANLLKEYLPQEKNPATSITKLSKQASFQKALKEARDDAKNAGDTENTEVCKDVLNYNA
ncbi:MCR_0457 family protein [Acinetobacter sp. ANC 4648]|uniref:MCR_0457 family protein n=1 Tax=Acinetobacter sp. ANC 4648 TaxID=1977875 RepID=UPI000A3314CD|nr:hypothetical protein [Acinetobacter sp. ANC 4648]OTG83576.1 hypothetical protein B9T27_03415 [Acinetobacter sp. ANC 4648]